MNLISYWLYQLGTSTLSTHNQGKDLTFKSSLEAQVNSMQNTYSSNIYHCISCIIYNTDQSIWSKLEHTCKFFPALEETWRSGIEQLLSFQWQ